MSIQFEARVCPKHLSLACTGTYTLESLLRLYEDAFRHAADAGKDAVLVDVRNVKGREPTLTERYDQAVHLADLQAGQATRIRLAVLGHEPMIHPERFGEIVAANRGAVSRVFTDEDMALDWLLGR